MAYSRSWLKGRKISLMASIGLAFALSLVPLLAVMVGFSYRANSRNLRALTQTYSERSGRDTMAAVEGLLAPVASTLRVTAELAVIDPGFFRRERSRDYLYKALNSAEQIDAIYASFEDGYHRVVTRVDEVRRRNDPRIPAAAQWHSSWVNPYAAGVPRVRRRTFFDVWPRAIKSYDVAHTVDIRELEHYRGAKKARELFVAEPLINPDTGGPVISLGYPVLSGGRFVGFTAANITFDIIARHLDAHRVSPGSVTVIVDSGGRVIAHPDLRKAVRESGGRLDFAELAAFPDAPVAQAALARAAQGKSRVAYRAGVPAREYVASFSPFPANFGKSWEVLTVTPTDDFLGPLKSANRDLLLLMALLALLELFLIFWVARRLAEPIDSVSLAMQGLRSLHFGETRRRDSAIREVARLEKAVELLQSSLKSLAAFVPLGVVRRLASSGRSVVPHVEPRELTIFFIDVEDFTTIAERLPPRDLTEQLSAYFEVVTAAISGEGGTIDKFIGDAVMAFWGAPAPVEDPALKACAAALRVARRMRNMNLLWGLAGKPRFSVRIGLHRGTALVGNIGSTDRLSYTAVGDAVNVASRLEGVNKQFGTTICLSEDVYAAVKGRIAVRALDAVKVKGREQAVQAYELLGILESRDAELRPPDPAV